MEKEKFYKLIEEKLGNGWFELNDDDIKKLFEFVKLYSDEVKPIAVKMKGMNEVSIITEEEFNSKFEFFV